MSKSKDNKLDSILTEINSGIKKSKNENNLDKKSKTSSEISNSSDDNQENDKSSFIQTAKIIEKEPESVDVFDKKSKYVEVKAVQEAKEIDETKQEISDNEATNETESKSVKKEKSSSNKKTSEVNNKRDKKAKRNYSKSQLKKENGTAVARQPNSKRKSTKRQNRIAVFGFFITLFVIIGLITTITSAVKLTNRLVNDTDLKNELVTDIFPLVIVDVPEFETATKLDNNAIIASSIWDFIIDEKNKTKYKKDDFGSIYVPDVDIEKHIRHLYGSDVKITHQSIDDSNVQMTYDPESKYYIIESTPKFLPYTPRIDKIVKSGNMLTATVSYVLPDAMWNLNVDEKSQVVDKVMEYKIKKIDDTYQIISVKLLEVRNTQEMDAGQNKDEIYEDELIDEEDVSSEEQIIPEDKESATDETASTSEEETTKEEETTSSETEAVKE